MILELFGSPGSGKTYAINQIHPGAIKEQKNIVDSMLEPLKRIIKNCLALTPYAFKIRHIIYDSLSNVSLSSPKYKPVRINDFIWNISMLGAVYKYSKGNIFMDEGIVHRTISMSINYGINRATCCTIIKNLSFVIENVRVLFLDVPIDICMKSIEDRNRHMCSIDELSGDELFHFLKAYEEYCKHVALTFKFEQIDRSNINKNMR